MMDFLEHQRRMMEKTSEFWQEVLSGSPWLKQPDTPFKDMCDIWISNMRSTSDASLSAWKTAMESSEETFFKMLNESKVYGQAVENRLRESWGSVKKAQVAQHQAMRDFLGTMEKVLVRQQQDEPS